MQLSSPERTFITYKITKQCEDRNNPTMLALMATWKYCSVYGTLIGSESLGLVSITAKNQAAVAKILKSTLCSQDLTDRKLQIKEIKCGCPCKTEAGGWRQCTEKYTLFLYWGQPHKNNFIGTHCTIYDFSILTYFHSPCCRHIWPKPEPNPMQTDWTCRRQCFRLYWTVSPLLW